MKTGQSGRVRRRWVKLLLDEDRVIPAKAFAGNMCEVVESLLVTDDVKQARREQHVQPDAGTAMVAMWNDFNVRRGSFAEEHCTL